MYEIPEMHSYTLDGMVGLISTFLSERIFLRLFTLSPHKNPSKIFDLYLEHIPFVLDLIDSLENRNGGCI